MSAGLAAWRSRLHAQARYQTSAVRCRGGSATVSVPVHSPDKTKPRKLKKTRRRKPTANQEPVSHLCSTRRRPHTGAPEAAGSRCSPRPRGGSRRGGGGRRGGGRPRSARRPATPSPPAA
eukprot:1857692-Rhodomonas_salina.3